MRIIPITHANAILAFLQNIENDDDAREFVRIALDAIEAGAEHVDYAFGDFEREAVILRLNSFDKRIELVASKET